MMRQNHEQIITWYSERMKVLRLEREKTAKADTTAFVGMQKAKADAERGKREAERRLAIAFADTLKLKEAANAVDHSDPLPVRPVDGADGPSTGCVLPPGVRQSINAYIASINNHPDVGYSTPDSARFSDGPNSPDSVLTCSDLTASVTDILEHDAITLLRA